MNTFAYQARDAQGKTVKGTTDATSEEGAINGLMARGLMVLSIEQKGTGKGPGRVKVGDTDLVLFTRQLATMVDAGLPLISALTGLYEQADPVRQKGLRAIIGDITGRVQQGDTFHEALTRHPRVFSRLYVSMIRAGEAGGMLAEILDRLAGFLEANARLVKKVKSAMTYPTVVISIALLITVFLIVKVVPVFAEIFSDFGSELPGPTRFLISLSDIMRTYWWLFAAVILGTYFSVRTFVRTERGSQMWDRTKLKLPVFGPLIRKIALSRFARTFAQLVRSGVPILEVMSIVGETSGNYVIETAIKNVSLEVEKGSSFTAGLSKEPIFPPMILRMVSAGEATGKTDAMLEKMADFWDEEIEAMLNALTSMMEPFLIVFLGFVVGGIVIAMFLPIFKLSDVVGK